ncbi:PPC domain-containing DNA-binding protein [Castellaniella sp.]|uniref:PPC domain-containing DNA-binding protein n=1 Tax=Castellaniella sp. TaxID=1955812 RepID=UPI0035632AF5
MAIIERGAPGRIFYVRIHPNEDLVRSIEHTAREAGLGAALVRSSVGSLAHACLEVAAGRLLERPGPALEIMTLQGEVRATPHGLPEARLAGVVMDLQGQFHAGRFVRGRNPACMTIEVVLEEWCIEQQMEFSVDE